MDSVSEAWTTRPPLVKRGFVLKSGTADIITGDALSVLRQLPSNHFHCCVTSPPYYGLRDYGTAQWEGGDSGCDHVQRNTRGDAGRPATLVARGTGGALIPSGSSLPVDTPMQFRDTCGKCGARRIDQQIGLEQSPEDYVATLVEVFREVRRVLRDDGTLWLNLGDSYSSGLRTSFVEDQLNPGRNGNRVPAGIGKPKDLLMMPARMALALQADGWWLRSAIVWNKPNPMPESVTDRPTSAYEHVFLLAKSARYFYDAEAVREEGTIPSGTLGAKGSEERFATPGVNSRPPEYKVYTGTRNMRNVWSLPTIPYEGAHFAVMPTALVERCIKAGTSERGCCAKCGAPWVRMVERDTVFLSGSGRAGKLPVGKGRPGDGQIREGHDIRMGNTSVVTTTGWAPSCSCNADIEPCRVLDPFAGTCTTGMVAGLLARHSTMIELNPDYVKLAQKRLKDAQVPSELK